jgi:hypothetical protein
MSPGTTASLHNKTPAGRQTCALLSMPRTRRRESPCPAGILMTHAPTTTEEDMVVATGTATGNHTHIQTEETAHSGTA